jgi:hypothetical protein
MREPKILRQGNLEGTDFGALLLHKETLKNRNFNLFPKE